MGTLGRYFRNHPSFLEKLYRLTHEGVSFLSPLIQKAGYQRVDALLRWPERKSKELLFDCTMCGQCILHSTGMTCPMTCPKNLRNGPCGGVREDGNCEVLPDMRCVWVEAFERSQRMPEHGAEIHHIQPPVNRQLEGSSAWVNLMSGVDRQTPEGWVGLNTIPVIEN